MGRPPVFERTEALKKGAWTPEEDIILACYVQEHGPGNWSAVPNNTVLRRSGKSCRLRWTNYLRPGIKHCKFSPEEEKKIIYFHALFGNRWAAIAAQLPGRTDNYIKNYWNHHVLKLYKKRKNGQPFGRSTATDFSTNVSKENWERKVHTNVQKPKQALNIPLSLSPTASSATGANPPALTQFGSLPMETLSLLSSVGFMDGFRYPYGYNEVPNLMIHDCRNISPAQIQTSVPTLSPMEMTAAYHMPNTENIAGVLHNSVKESPKLPQADLQPSTFEPVFAASNLSSFGPSISYVNEGRAILPNQGCNFASSASTAGLEYDMVGLYSTHTTFQDDRTTVVNGSAVTLNSLISAAPENSRAKTSDDDISSYLESLEKWLLDDAPFPPALAGCRSHCC